MKNINKLLSLGTLALVFAFITPSFAADTSNCDCKKERNIDQDDAHASKGD